MSARRVKGVESHCHLDGSVRLATIEELARQQGLQYPTPVAGLEVPRVALLPCPERMMASCPSRGALRNRQAPSIFQLLELKYSHTGERAGFACRSSRRKSPAAVRPITHIGQDNPAADLPVPRIVDNQLEHPGTGRECLRADTRDPWA